MKKRGERFLGPYEDRAGWRVIEVDAKGKRSSSVFDSEGKAERYIELMRAELSTEAHTTASALEAYLDYLARKGTKEQSRYVAEWAINLFFPEPILLSMLSTKRCQRLYDDLTGRISKRTKRPISVDTHRNARDRVSCFLSFCVSKGWLAENPVKAKVRGIGKKRPRGKSLGLAGNELRVKQARLWYVKALELAEGGDEGAVASLMALLLGLRASEIINRKVGDLDEDEQAGDLLWIPCAKTAAGKRTLEVPDPLRELLVAQAKDRKPGELLFVSKRKPGIGHNNNWPIAQVRRICDAAEVPQVTAHAMRGLLSTITAERGMAGHLIAATLGHADTRITRTAYMAPGAESAGDRRRGLVVLSGGAK